MRRVRLPARETEATAPQTPRRRAAHRVGRAVAYPSTSGGRAVRVVGSSPMTTGLPRAQRSRRSR